MYIKRVGALHQTGWYRRSKI